MEEIEVAKSSNRPVDKVERQARVDSIHRQRKVQEREMRNLNRMGWQEFDDEDDLEQEGQWPDTEVA